MKKLIGTCRREGIDWIQDRLGEAHLYAEVSTRPVAECTFFDMIENKTIVMEDFNVYLMEDFGEEELHTRARNSLRSRSQRAHRPTRTVTMHNRKVNLGKQNVNQHDHANHMNKRVNKKDGTMGLLLSPGDPTISDDA